MPEMTKREKYRNALCLARGGEVQVEGVRKSLLPHIDDHTFEGISRMMFNTQSLTHLFFAPSLVIRGVAHVISVYRTARASTLMCVHSGTKRLPDSIERAAIGWEGYKKPDPREVDSIESACRYAEAHWGDQLVTDRSVQVLTGHVIKAGSSNLVGAFSATLNNNLPGLHKLHREPRSELLDDAIIKVSAERLIMEELESCRQTWWAMFCSQCGGGITSAEDTVATCNFCDAVFPLARAGGQSWRGALPSKAIAALHAKGVRFDIDPNRARYQEHIDWAEAQKGEPLRPGEPGALRNHRVIDLAGNK